MWPHFVATFLLVGLYTAWGLGVKTRPENSAVCCDNEFVKSSCAECSSAGGSSLPIGRGSQLGGRGSSGFTRQRGERTTLVVVLSANSLLLSSK